MLIDLDKNALAFLSDTSPMLLKKKIIQSFESAFGQIALAIAQKSEWNNLNVNKQWVNKSGKISKGENHQDLPFVVLDTPFYLFEKDFLLCRTMFWWGKYCSISLIIKGEFFEHSFNAALKMLKQNDQQELMLLQTSDLWNNDLETENYRQADQETAQLIWSKHKHFKLSKSIPFSELNSMHFICLEFVEKWIFATRLLQQ